MSCNCTKIKDLPTCINELVIGTIALISQDVDVFIENTSLGHKIKLIGVADGDGIVTVDLTELPTNFFSESYSYDIKVTDVGSLVTEDITIDSIDYTCLMVKFRRIEDNALEAVYYSTVIAVIE